MVRKAFTIIELLIVLSVLGIILAFAIPRFKGMQDSAKLTQVRNELKSLEAAIESYHSFSGSKAYPPSSTTLCSSYLMNTYPRLIKAPLIDPFSPTGAEYNYLSSSNGKYYTAWSVGIGGQNIPSAISNSGRISY